MRELLGRISAGLESNNEKLKNSLRRYFFVLNNDSPSKSQVTKYVSIDTNLESSSEELWKAHKDGLKHYGDLLKELDEERIDLQDLSMPESSLLDLKVKLAQRIIKSCHFCEHDCQVNRTQGETGFCGVEEQSRVSSEFMHHGEEPELVPSYTIFFSGCTFQCQFCQNWGISQNPDNGVKKTPKELADSISGAREKGALNVNWVGGDPTPNLHNILSALNKSRVNIPSVWNSNMYLSLDGMKLLSGTQDIFLTDFKYGNNDCALKYSKIPNYWETVSRNHELAFEDSELIIRHLVLPGHIDCCTKPILEWIAENLSKDVRINVMGQYRPSGEISVSPSDYGELNRRPKLEEMEEAYQIAKNLGLNNVAK
ncbi:MAG: radical SAM protein [Hadesarchaea archaeon]|nr:radical SAM protein [Hadesarchaea archaeon]